MAKRICSVDGCEKPHEAHGFCPMHLYRYHRYGDPLGGGPFLQRSPERCTVDGCEKSVVARGFCTQHYQRWRLYGDPLAPRKDARRPCKVPGCDTLALCRGLCTMHYQRWNNHGDPMYEPPTPPPPEERFWAKVVKGDGCWEWATPSTLGYGYLNVRGRPVRANIFAWELVAGPVPNGLFVCHTCDNPPCVRNDDIGVYLLNGVEHPRRGHLWLGNVKDNAEDMVAKGRGRGAKRKTHCLRGHEFTEANTYIYPSGKRACLACILYHREKARLARLHRR